VGEGTASSMLL